MERTRTSKPNPPQLVTQQQQMEALALAQRLLLSSALGMSHGGDRNLYNVLGYPTEIKYEDYAARYGRQDIANGIISRPASATWAGNLQLVETNDAEETQFEKAWMDLWQDETLQLKNRFARVDRLTGIGEYGVLLLGFNDVRQTVDFQNAVTAGSTLKLLYVKPFSQKTAQILTTEDSPASERYGLPQTYSLQLNNHTLTVHHSRVIHVVWDRQEDEVKGTPVLQAVFNRLMDLEKLAGGSAEMFWRGAYAGINAEVDKEFAPPTGNELEDQIKEYEHNLRRIITTHGMKLNTLSPQVADPTTHVQVQVDLIAAKTGIPKRILLGSERGELSSAQDADTWNAYIQARREELVEPQLLRPFINRLIALKILPKPTANTYKIQWPSLYEASEQAKATVGKTRAEALAHYAKDPLAQSIVPPPAFMEMFLGLSETQIELVLQMVAEQASSVKETTPEEEEELNA